MTDDEPIHRISRRRSALCSQVFQLMGIGSLTVPLAAALNNEPLAVTTAAGVAAVVGGAAACSLVGDPVRSNLHSLYPSPVRFTLESKAHPRFTHA